MVGGGYCRLLMPLKLAFAIRETVAGHTLGALEPPPPPPSNPTPRPPPEVAEVAFWIPPQEGGCPRQCGCPQ